MKLSKKDKVKYIDIWQPRYHDRVVLIAKHKVGEHNIIRFTKVPEYSTYSGSFYLSGDTIRRYPIDSNGKIDCYAVSLDELMYMKGENNMAGTRAGGIKAAKTNLKRYGKYFYKRIGHIGGQRCITGGFASEVVGKDGLTGLERAKVAGRKGGTISRRRINNEQINL